MNRTFVFGDIEDNEDAFKDVIECIRSQSLASRFIFLGDIYTPKFPSLAIKHIAQIIWELGVPIHKLIDIDFDEFEASTEETYNFCESIKRAFSNLRKEKRVDIYTVNNKFRTGTQPDKSGLIPNDEVEAMIRNDLSSSAPARYHFLFGNKEVDILKDLSNVADANIIDGRFIAHFIYYRKHVRNESVIEFSLKELNILLNYLTLCHHFYYETGHLPTMYQHIYTNARAISKYAFFPKVARIVAGHNRCYGRYKDSSLHAEIYMLDITHEKIKGIRNCLMLAGDKLYYFASNVEIRELLRTRLSANKTFLKGGWDDDASVTTLDFYQRSNSLRSDNNRFTFQANDDKSNHDSD